MVGISVPLDAGKAQIEAALAGHDTPPGFIFTDSQHSAFSEETLAQLAGAAHDVGIPLQFRIKHTQFTYLIGNWLDLGPLMIEVPQVETEDTAAEVQLSLSRSPGSLLRRRCSLKHGRSAGRGQLLLRPAR